MIKRSFESLAFIGRESQVIEWFQNFYPIEITSLESSGRTEKRVVICTSISCPSGSQEYVNGEGIKLYEHIKEVTALIFILSNNNLKTTWGLNRKLHDGKKNKITTWGGDKRGDTKVIFFISFSECLVLGYCICFYNVTIKDHFFFYKLWYVFWYDPYLRFYFY